MRTIIRHAAMLAAAATLLNAGQVTDQFDVIVTVQGACTVTANDLDFGTYTGAQLDATTSINVNCTLLTPYTLSLSAGGGGEADFTPRQMTGETNTSQILDYDLYTSFARTTVWGDGTNGSGTQSGVGLGTALPVVHTVYGRIDSGKNVQPQSYRDTVTAIVDY